CIACQVVSPQPFEGANAPLPEESDGVAKGIVGYKGLAVRIPQRQARATQGTGSGLGVEAPVVGVFVLGAASGTEVKGRHRGACPVVRRTADDRQTRTAIGAVEERIAVAAVGRVEQLGQAGVAGGDVGANEDGTGAFGLAHLDAETPIAPRGTGLPANLVD